MTNNQINYQRSLEDKRAHLAAEIETNRANVARETETQRANKRQEELTAARDAETARSNLAREIETNRSNRANEALTSRKTDYEHSDRRYASDVSAAASRYAADQNYAGRIDSAYINRYGVAPTTISQAAEAIGDTVDSAIRSETGRKAARATMNAINLTRVAGVAALATTFHALGAQKTADQNKQTTPPRAKGGHRKEN